MKRIGFDASTIEHRGLSVEAILDFAVGHGLDFVSFRSPTLISPDLDPARLARVRGLALARGLWLEVGLPSINPTHRPAHEGRTPDPVAHADALIPQVEALATLGCRIARTSLGGRTDRLRSDMSWFAQMDACLEVIERLNRPLRTNGLQLAIETSGAVTSGELLDFIADLDDALVGVALNLGNLPLTLEDAAAAVEKLAPRVLTTQVKDAVLLAGSRGFTWQARPAGSGGLPMADLLATLHKANPGQALSIELNPGTVELPAFEPSWLACFPSLGSASLAAVARLALTCGRRYDEGSLGRIEAVEAIPWAGRDLDWLASSLGYLRKMAAMLESIPM